MTHSPAYILTQYLIGEGLLFGPVEGGDWVVFVGSLPDGDNVQNDAAALIDTAPLKDGRVMGGAPLFHPGIQILLRSSVYNTGYSKSISLATKLAGVDDVEVTVESGSSYNLVGIMQISGVIPLGQEPGTKRRWLFSTNFIATIQEV